MSTVTRDQIIAAAAAKGFKKAVNGYKGPPGGLRTYLNRYLHDLETKADRILAEAFEQIIAS